MDSDSGDEETKGGAGPAEHAERSEVKRLMKEIGDQAEAALATKEQDTSGAAALRKWAGLSKAALDAYAPAAGREALDALPIVPGRQPGPTAWPAEVPTADQFPEGCKEIAIAIVAARHLAYSEACLACADDAQDVEEARQVAREVADLVARNTTPAERSQEIRRLRRWRRATAAYAIGAPRAMETWPHPERVGNAAAREQTRMLQLGVHAADSKRMRAAIKTGIVRFLWKKHNRVASTCDGICSPFRERELSSALDKLEGRPVVTQQDMYTRAIPTVPPPLMYTYTYDAQSKCFVRDGHRETAGGSTAPKRMAGTPHELAAQHGLPADLWEALREGEARAVHSPGPGASVAVVDRLRLEYVDGSRFASPAFHHRALRDCVPFGRGNGPYTGTMLSSDGSAALSSADIGDWTVQPDCGVVQFFDKNCVAVRTDMTGDGCDELAVRPLFGESEDCWFPRGSGPLVTFWKYVGGKGCAPTPVAGIVGLEFTGPLVRLRAGAASAALNSGQAVVALTASCSATAGARGRAAGEGRDCAGAAMALFSTPTDAQPCAVSGSRCFWIPRGDSMACGLLQAAFTGLVPGRTYYLGAEIDWASDDAFEIGLAGASFTWLR
ncbi:hypothetical protein JKP88DRAFT_273001 [Tribonema minus]|uniref:Uncharacterized protein n=1 Tax=Tribonema minus TaxID=303371 RepID=A0A835YWM6_9STRA|nr:hypothetical protein JKP88DRAFT_273001 [Tribonema minus]